MLSARVGTGAISAMGYASRLHNSLLQAVVLSVSIVLLPHFARRVAEGKEAELRATFERLFAATLLFAAGAVVFVAAGGPAAIQLLLERGHFTSADARLVASVWLALSLGLLGATWNQFLVRLLQAQQRVWVILSLSGVLAAAGVTFAYLLLPWGVVGVAVGNSAAYTLVMWLSHRRIGQTLGRMLSARAWRFVFRAMLLNLVAYAAAVGWARLVADLGPIVVITGQLLLVTVANLLVVPTPPLSVPLNTLLRR
jgi:peptidoglycan biosynthesis protein MviN/MurJ (putative lipid II flippase)